MVARRLFGYVLMCGFWWWLSYVILDLYCVCVCVIGWVDTCDTCWISSCLLPGDAACLYLVTVVFAVMLD